MSLDFKSVMVVSANEKMTEGILSLLRSAGIGPVTVALSAGDARREFAENPADAVIINAPLKDEFGSDLAVGISQDSASGVLLLVRGELYEGICDKVETAGVLTVPKPASAASVIRALHLLAASVSRLHDYRRRTETLETKMQEIRLVNRAKLILVERLKMSETEAHRYIEKTAMDSCIKRREVAEKIIKTYED